MEVLEIVALFVKLCICTLLYIIVWGFVWFLDVMAMVHEFGLIFTRYS